jgi:hypothetical protein
MTDSISNAARAVCDALRHHAEACENEPNNIGRVISAGETLSGAVLQYEKALAEQAGWSNPIRHLGPPVWHEQVARSATGSDALHGDEGISLVLSARYEIRVFDDEALLTFVEGRFGDRTRTIENAIELLCRAEGWDPGRYPPGLLALDGLEIDVVDDSPQD